MSMKLYNLLIFHHCIHLLIIGGVKNSNTLPPDQLFEITTNIVIRCGYAMKIDLIIGAGPSQKEKVSVANS